METPGRQNRSRWAVRHSLLPALVLTPCLLQTAGAELLFTPPQFLPGDDAIGAPAGLQLETEVAWGDGQFLAVWSDGRTTPDNYSPPTEGSGTDIYGIRLDASGNVIDAGAFVINQDFGDQIEPTVAWNGENWLVVWKRETPTTPTYEMLEGVRVAPDGTVLDATPIVIHDDDAYYDWMDAVVVGGAGEWLVGFQANGPVSGLIVVKVSGDGVVTNPGGLQVHDSTFWLDFDIAFAGDEFLVIWGGTFDAPRARRYTPDLQVLGTSVIPFSGRVTSNGNNFLVAATRGSPPLATVEAFRIAHGGLAFAPVTLYNAGNQEGTCCEDVTWDGTYYWVSWGGIRFARVTTNGVPRDIGGFEAMPLRWPVATPSFAPLPAGGLLAVYNDGSNGAGYPKDVYAAQLPDAGGYVSEALVSLGAPAQLDTDFAEGNGVNVIAFRSRSSADGRIRAHRIDDAGVALDAEPIEVASGPMVWLGLPYLGEPGVAWNGSVFMITWSDGLQIFARRMLPDGTFLDATPRTVMAGHDPDVAAVGQVFLVVGLDYISGNPQWQATFSMRVDGATGQNLDPESSPLGGFAIFARHPHVVSWGDRWLAVWQRNLSHDNTIAGTWAAIVDADGTTPGLIQVPTGWRPDVAVSDDRALFVAVTQTIASATTDLEGAVMEADGTFPGGSFLISAAADKQLMPAATWNGSEFVVAWEDKRGSVIYFDERTDIYGARVAPDGTVLDPGGVALAAATVPEVKPALLSIGSTTLLAVSTFRDEPTLGAYRIGLQASGGAATGITETPGPTGPSLRLLGARPNPSRGSTSIRFESRASQAVSLRIFDPAGRLVRTLAGGPVHDPSAPAEVQWDGRDDAGRPVRAGVFFYELRTASGSASGKLVRLD